MPTTRKSRTLLRPGQGGAWKILFRNPIQGTYADKPFINRTLFTILKEQCDLDEESHFKVACVRGGCLGISHIVKSDDGMDVHALIASLPPSFLLD